MSGNDQTKQVFVDETGRRSRLLLALGRVAGVVVVCYLVLLVAGFMGASWVPLVRLPIVGDIFDVGGPDLPAEIAGSAPSPTEQAPSQDTTQTEVSASGAAPVVTAGAQSAQNKGASASHPSRSNNRSNGNSGKAGPKPEPSPTPNHGSNGNSNDAGPKPKPRSTPRRGSSSSKGQAPEPASSPTP